MIFVNTFFLEYSIHCKCDALLVELFSKREISTNFHLPRLLFFYLFIYLFFNEIISSEFTTFRQLILKPFSIVGKFIVRLTPNALYSNEIISLKITNLGFQTKLLLLYSCTFYLYFIIFLFFFLQILQKELK